MILVKNLNCARNEQTLFRNVAFNLTAGEILEVVGKNGCGKTTLLRTIGGLLPPLSGQICLDASVCYVGHNAGLHPDLTIQQNLEFLLILMGFVQKSFASMIQKALEYLQIKHKMTDKCSQLSAGQLQKVNIARLFLTDAKLWLLDEPLANLDAQAQAKLIDMCTCHVQANGAIIVATHNPFNITAAHKKMLNLEEYAE